MLLREQRIEEKRKKYYYLFPGLKLQIELHDEDLHRVVLFTNITTWEYYLTTNPLTKILPILFH
jgi:hypothetical protein